MGGHVFRLFLFPVTLLILLGNSLYSQRSLIRTYTVGDGLVMNRVRGFHQDKDGFIWMYTWDGLSRYEGYRFRNYISGRDLQHSFVNDIFELPDGTLYLPLNDGTTAVMRNEEIQPEVLAAGVVINDFCTDDKGRIYAAADKIGIREFKNGKLLEAHPLMKPLSIQQIIFYQDHFFFIGPYAGPSGVLNREMKLVASWIASPAFYTTMYKDHRNQIFVCTMEGLKEVDLSKSTFPLKDASIIPADAPWKNWNVNAVVVTPENDTWIGTNKGLVHLRSDQSWTILTIQEGLLSNQISSLFLDKSNTLWIGTDAGAASINLQTKIIDNRNLQGVFTNFVLPNRDSTIYIITGYAYLIHLDRYLNTIHSESIANPANFPQALIPRENEMLLVRQASIEQVDATVFPFQPPDKIDAGIIYAKIRDKYWITTHDFYCATIPGTSNAMEDSTLYVTTIAAARSNQLLIGTLEAGVFLARTNDVTDKCKIEKVRDLSEYTEDLRIRSLFTSKNGDIWIGTRFNGVVRLQCNKDYSNCKKQTYTISDGLVSNWITSITEDQLGNIWVGSASGIDKLKPRDDAYYVFSFSRVNSYYANVRHIVLHSDGSLLVGHGEGLSRIIDGRIDTIGPPVTYITEVSLGGNDYPTLQTSAVSLRYHQNSAHFAFAAPDFINSSQLMFTYRLLGSKDTTWSKAVKTHEIFYGNLRPGKFRFEVATFGWNGERSAPVSYAFEILNPFWKQAWFMATSILLMAIGIFALYRFRISQLHRVQSVRDRIAADLHDEIGSTLTHINILSEIGRQQQLQHNGSENLFERIGAEIQTSSEALDDIIWSVRTKRDAIGDIFARMRQYATELFEPAGIEFQMHERVDGVQSLEMEFKRDFYLVYKEILRNVLRHADATTVSIEINVDRSCVSMKINDNGKGFDVHAPTDRSGILNIHSRVKKWNGGVVWNSVPGVGTTVAVDMRPS